MRPSEPQLDHVERPLSGVEALTRQLGDTIQRIRHQGDTFREYFAQYESITAELRQDNVEVHVSFDTITSAALQAYRDSTPNAVAVKASSY